jgi:hypothetical protein
VTAMRTAFSRFIIFIFLRGESAASVVEPMHKSSASAPKASTAFVIGERGRARRGARM